MPNTAEMRVSTSTSRVKAPCSRACLAPVVVSGPGRIAEHQEPLLLRQSPQIGNGEEGAQRRGAEPPPVGRGEAGFVEARETFGLKLGRRGIAQHEAAPSLDMDIVQI